MRFDTRLIFAALLMLIAAACQPAPQSNPNVVGGVDTSLIQWERSPSNVVFRADVVGGSLQGTFLERNEIPACTVYGDNHVVWTNELNPGNLQVLHDRVADSAVALFVTYLTVNERLYTYVAQANVQLPSNPAPVVETLSVFVNGVNHEADSFSGWDGDYYPRLRDACRQISTAPVIFEPTAGFLSAQVVPYDSSIPFVVWDSQASGLRLADLAASGERRWITDRNVPVLWNLLRTSPYNVQLEEDRVQYQIALEIPGVTRLSPPAPG